MPYEMLTSQLGRSRRMDLVRYRCSCLGPVLVIAVVFVGMVGSERWRAFSAADVWTVYAGMGLEVLFRPGAVSFTFGTWRLEGEACIHGVTYWHTCSLIGLGIHFAHFIRFSWYA